jgi:preprotein translocase subunit YajC
MRSLLAIVAAALLLGTAAGAQAQPGGTVVRVDPQSHVIVLDDGRMYRVTPSTVLVVDNRPTPITEVRPGQRVIIQSGEVATPPVVAQPPATVITQPPATAVPAGVRQTFYGRVEDVDRDGEVKIRTDRASFEVKVAPEMLRHIRKGDAVTLDLTINPPGAPSALPR